MVLILAASLLFHALKPKNSKHRRLILPFVTAIPDLSFNPNSRNGKKNIRNAWENGHLKNYSDFKIGHDTLNNSITPHKWTNDSRPCYVVELVAFLQGHSDRIKATVYCQRFGAENIQEQLLKSGILVIHSTKHLVSRRKQKKTNIISRCFQRNQDPEIEPKSLGSVLKHQSNLGKLLKKRGGKENCAKINGRRGKSRFWLVSDSIS